MGIADKMFDYEEVARSVLENIGAIASCDAHDDYYYNTGAFDDKEIYARATTVVQTKADYSSYTDMKAFHAAIKKVLDEAAIDSDCPFCAKAYNE